MKIETLPKEQQHKKCYELLKAFVCTKKPEIWERYLLFCSLLELPPPEQGFEEIERRFHFHVQRSGRGLSEHDFLNSITTKDRKEGEPWLSIHTYLDGLRSAHNVGSIMRTIEAFRLGPICLSDDMMSPTTPRIQKTSMGACEHIHITKELPRPWIALETAPNALSWNEYLYPRAATLFLGNEERGLSRKVLQECDIIVSIPLWGCKNSLNVANAFAIVAAEIAYQQRHGL